MDRNERRDMMYQYLDQPVRFDQRSASHVSTGDSRERRDQRKGQGGRDGHGNPLVNACVLAGVLAAVLLSLLGWVGMIQSVWAALHSLAPTLLIGAMLGLAVAILAPHLFPPDRR
jgi:hypothetical protein